ncbi:MAG: ABC transporter permease [Armatimonadetes bacterium]|nr:ABC transporter permease [Armatimonadota bacterium]
MAVKDMGKQAGSGIVARLLKSRELSVVAVLALLCLGMAFTEQRANFFGPLNMTNILQQVALLSLFAIGETIVIITSGIDLSLGSIIAFAGMLVALFVTKFSVGLIAGPAALLAIVLTLLCALAIGLLHATLIHKLKLPPFVVTLAALLVLRSQSLIVNKQLPISLNDYPLITDLSKGWPLWTMLVMVAVVAHILLTRTRIGRYLYALGGNEQATRLSGVNIFKIKLFAYGVSALLGGLAGILWAGYGRQGNPQLGQGYELDAVAAAVVGGASLTGGRGSVPGTILGATLVITILSAINFTFSNPDIWRGTVVGCVLLFAVLVTALQQKGGHE